MTVLAELHASNHKPQKRKKPDMIRLFFRASR